MQVFDGLPLTLIETSEPPDKVLLLRFAYASFSLQTLNPSFAEMKLCDEQSFVSL